MVKKVKINLSWGLFICLLPLFACFPQKNPQLDSLQRQISALRADIEELQEIRTDIKYLGSDVSNIIAKLEETSTSPVQGTEETSRVLLQNLADSKMNLQDLADEVSIMKENFHEHSQVIRSISDQMKTLESNLVKQILKLLAKVEESVPEKLFQAAQEFFMNRHYHEALKSFNAFISKYPKHHLTENARLFKGETLYRMGELEKAIGEFDLFASQYSQSPRIATAIFLKAESLLALKRNSEAGEHFRRLVTDYPDSQEAVRGRSLLESLP